MAGSGSAQYGGGPTPWWTLPQSGGRSGQATLSNLQQNSPEGYEYDPVKMDYVRTPTSAGNRYAQFTDAAMGGIPSLNGLSGGGAAAGGAFGGAAGTEAGGPVGAGGVAGEGGLKMPDMTKSNDAIFAQAKDKVGQQSRASLDSLAGELGAQGMLGSGGHIQAIEDITRSGAGELGQVTRDQAVNDAGTALDVAKTNYGGNITMRGQDIAAQEANARIAIAKQQQQYQLLNMIMSSLGGAAKGAAGSGVLY